MGHDDEETAITFNYEQCLAPANSFPWNKVSFLFTSSLPVVESLPWSLGLQ